MREVQEECGLAIRIVGLAGVVDRVIRDVEGRVRYHYVLVDYAAVPEAGSLRVGSDAADARWVPLAELGQYDTTEGLAAMIERALRVVEGGTVR